MWLFLCTFFVTFLPLFLGPRKHVSYRIFGRNLVKIVCFSVTLKPPLPIYTIYKESSTTHLTPYPLPPLFYPPDLEVAGPPLVDSIAIWPGSRNMLGLVNTFVPPLTLPQEPPF